MKTILLSLLFFACLGPSFGQNFNRPVPDGVFPYEYLKFGHIPGGYILTSPRKLFVQQTTVGYFSPAVEIFDTSGYLVWYAQPDVNTLIDFKYIPAVDSYVFSYAAQGTQGALLLDNQFNAVDTLVTTPTRDLHDLKFSENGNWLLAAAFYDTMDLSAYTFDGVQGSATTVVKGFGYEEMTQAGNSVQVWNSNTVVDPTETLDYWGYSSTSFDYCHGNAIYEDTDGNLLISYRHLNSVHKVDRQTGDIIWRLGGELSDFTFVNDSGFSGQHDVRRLPNGDLSIFDNGNETGTTRGVAFTLDTMNWTATKSKEFIHPVSATSNAMGSYQILDEGVQLLGYGRLFRPDPSGVFADSAGNLLAEYYFKDSVISYRFLHYDLTLPTRPEIVCDFNGSNYELTVLGSHNEIKWSTGESTQTISISQTGTYQVWVDQGIGMLGSLPFEFNSLNPVSCAVGLDELPQPEGNFILFDVLGKEVQYPEKNTVYIKVFESGYIQKVVFE